MATGKVYLVGAGPGDPKLITVRGLECLRRAEVLVYDRLGTAGLLREVPRAAERIYVGKAPGRHFVPQEEINQLLVQKALEGKTVVRLKGGDPFVFGRGGEEAEALVSHNIPFEVVPGVTSAISAPAYAGIPVTHRSCNSSFTVVTGHERPGKAHSSLDWPSLAAGTGTVVFLMGLGNLPHIVRHLIEHGRSPETPVALVSAGTCPEQKTVTGTLADIVERAAEGGITSPAVIVVGDVVRLRERLRWWDNRPLFGRRVAVVRRWDAGTGLADAIAEAGGDPLEIVVVSGVAAGGDGDVDGPGVSGTSGASGASGVCDGLGASVGPRLRGLREAAFVLLTDAAGAEALCDALAAAGLDARALAGVHLIALGDAGVALRQRWIRPDGGPESGLALVGSLAEHGVTDVLLADPAAAGPFCRLVGPGLSDLGGVRLLCADGATAAAAARYGIVGQTLSAGRPEDLAGQIARAAAATVLA